MLGPVPAVVECFQDRPEMAQLEAAAGRTAVVGQLLVGMGGVGKSQLAARYARDVYEAGRVDVLLWVTAVSPEAVTDAYAHAAAQILGADSTDPQAAWRFRNWLELPPGERQGGSVAGARPQYHPPAIMSNPGSRRWAAIPGPDLSVGKFRERVLPWRAVRVVDDLTHQGLDQLREHLDRLLIIGRKCGTDTNVESVVDAPRLAGRTR